MRRYFLTSEVCFDTDIESLYVEHTVVKYNFEFEPKFWIPPLIGPYVMQKNLKNDSVRALYRIEALAQARQP